MGHTLATTPSPLPGPGDVLGGKYRLEVELGRGGMGVVFRAQHLRLGEPVAIKMLLPQALLSYGAVERFDREARAAARIKSPYAARVLDIDHHNELPYMVMEFLEGRDLSEELRERGPLPVVEVLGWVQQVCSAMQEAHEKGIIHRDLKPSNLFLAKTLEGRMVKVLDFGISKIVAPTEANLTMTVMGLGTILYMSPEQVRSAKYADARSDVWSLGAILYELLSGQPPFLGESVHAIAAAIIADPFPPLSSLRPDLPPELVAVVHRALCKDREQRIPSMAALSEALRPFGPEIAVSSHPSGISLIPSVPKTPRSGPTPVLGDGVSHTQPGRVEAPFRSPRKPALLAASVVAVGVVAMVGVRLAVRPDEAASNSVEATTVAATGQQAASTEVSAPPPLSVAPAASSSGTSPGEQRPTSERSGGKSSGAKKRGVPAAKVAVQPPSPTMTSPPVPTTVQPPPTSTKIGKGQVID